MGGGWVGRCLPILSPGHHPSAIDLPEPGRTMVKKLDTCYGIRKGRGAPVVVHSWTEVVNKVSTSNTAAAVDIFRRLSRDV